MRTTHTLAVLDLSRAAYDEIARKLRAAGYEHAFDGELIDLTGLAAVPPAREEWGEPATACNPADPCAGCRCKHAYKGG